MYSKILQKVPAQLNKLNTTGLSLTRLFSSASASINQAKSKSNPKSKEIIQEKVRVSDKLEINYGKTGQGSQIILCIPGVFGTIETDFAEIMTKFDQKKYTILSLDLPGYGKSRPPIRQLGKNPYIKDAEAVTLLMKTLEIPKYSIVGWSNGGATGIHVAANNSPNVEKLIFWGAPAFMNTYSVKLCEVMSDSSNWIPSRWKSMLEIYGAEEMKRMLAEFHDYVEKAEKIGSYRVDMLLPTITCPTLILHGKIDMACPIDHPQLCHERIPKSLMEVWPQGQHDLHLEFQDRFIKRVEKFLTTAK